MSRGPRIALYVLAGLGGLILVAIIAALITIQTPWFRDQVRQRIVYELENATGGQVELRGFSFDWRALRAAVNGLVIRGTEAPGQPPLFRAESIEVVLKIVSALKRDIDILSLAVNRPEVNLIVYPDGRTNVPTPKAARKSEKTPVERILDLAINRFQIDGGTIVVDERTTPLNARGEDLRVRFFYETAQPRYRGEISFRKLYVKPGEMETLPLDFEARLALARNRLDIAGVRIAYKESTVDLNGMVENFAAPRAEIAYSAQVYLKEVAPALRIAAVPNRGQVTMGGRVVFSRAAGYDLAGHLRATGLAFEQRGLRVEKAGISSDVALTRDRLELNNLTIAALGGRLSGRAEVEKFRTFRLDASLRGFSLEELAAVQGARRMAWNGMVSGPVHVAGELLRGKPKDVKAQARLEIAPAPGPNPVSGLVDVSYRQRTGDLALGNSFVATRFSRVQFSGTLGKRMELLFESTNLDDFQPAIAMFSSGPPKPLPVSLKNGTARFRGVVTGPLKDPRLNGHVEVESFVVEGRQVDRLEADVEASSDGARARNVRLRKEQLLLTGGGEIALRNWKALPASAISGALSVRAPNIATLAAESGQKLPLSGQLTSEIKISNTLGHPHVNARIDLAKGAFGDQPFDRIQAGARYSEGLLEVAPAQIQAGPSRLRLSAVYTHPADDLRRGRLKFELNIPGVFLGRLKAVQARSAGLDGQVLGQMSGEVEIAPSGFRIGSLNGKIALQNLAANQRPMGDLTLTAATAGPVLDLDLRGNLVGARVRGESEWRLEKDYPVRGTIEFTRMQFSTLLARFRPQSGQQEAPFRGFVQGKVSFSGSTLDPQSWRASLELPALEIRPSADAERLANGQELALRNVGPILVDLTPKGARVRQAQLAGKDTNLTVAGMIAFGARNPFDLRVRGGVNLAVLRDFEPRLYSSGKLALDASLRGPLSRPDVYGQIELQDASLNYSNFPNGIDKANGLIFLYRDRATIERLTAESGGGKVSLGGFVVFGPIMTFSLQANAKEMRVRYPEGVSTTLNAALTFTGTAERSVLGGEVTINRVSFNPQTDVGSLLAKGAQPVSTPARPNKFLQGVRFDIQIHTAPQVRLETAMTRGIQAEADLRLRGDPIRPTLLGRVLVNQGEVVFFGNRYTIDSGEIIFVNPAKIEPVVNLHLQTRVRGIDVTLNVNGPVSKPSVTYRSDPPLPFSDIVALLATGRAPSTTPGLVGARSELSQSWEQAGASALVSQAIANPVAGRLQRFFGVSRLKIDPSVSGVENTPEARLTLEQQITQDLTLTYITNLAQAQQQTIRIEWDLTKSWSAVALREENGLFGVDFLYKKRFK